MGVDASDLKNRRFADGDAVAIQKLGTIAVNTTEPVKPGDAVRFRHTNGAATAGHQGRALPDDQTGFGRDRAGK